MNRFAAASILSYAFLALTFAGDCLTTEWLNGNPRTEEKNRIFRDDNGDCRMGLFIAWKIFLLAAAAAVGGYLYFYTIDGHKTVPLIGLMGGIVTLITVKKNWDLYKKYPIAKEVQ